MVRKHRTQLTLKIDGQVYTVEPLEADPDVASKAYRLVKVGWRENYDVHVNDFGPECECLGFLRWGHCKHIDSLRAAKMI